MAPVVDGLIREYEGTVAIRKYDVDASTEGLELANEYGIQYVPAFVFLSSSGEHVDTIIGEVSEEALTSALDDLE